MRRTLIAPAIVAASLGLAATAFAQNAQMPSGATNGPPGTGYQGENSRALPPSTTGTAKPSSLGNASAAEAAARYKIEQGGFTSVRGLSKAPDGTWSGRAVKNGVEVAVSLDSAGNIAVQ